MMRLLTSFIPILVLSTATANLLAEGPQNPIRILPAAFPISDNHGVPATPAARLQRIADAKPATHTTPPLVGRELNQFLRRQNPQDPLGWKNPSTCNVGVCDTGLTCSVWDGNGALTNPATGICCASLAPINDIILWD